MQIVGAVRGQHAAGAVDRTGCQLHARECLTVGADVESAAAYHQRSGVHQEIARPEPERAAAHRGVPGIGLRRRQYHRARAVLRQAEAGAADRPRESQLRAVNCRKTVCAERNRARKCAGARTRCDGAAIERHRFETAVVDVLEVERRAVRHRGVRARGAERVVGSNSERTSANRSHARVGVVAREYDGVVGALVHTH